MKRRERNVRIGMFGGQAQRVVQCPANAGAQAFSQCFGNADALAVSAQCVSLPIPGIGVVGHVLLQLLCAGRHGHEDVEPGLLLGLQVGGVHATGFVGGVDAAGASFQPGVERCAKFAVVKQHPGSQGIGGLGQGLAVTGMQARPAFLQRSCCVMKFTLMRELCPFGHGVSSCSILLSTLELSCLPQTGASGLTIKMHDC